MPNSAAAAESCRAARRGNYGPGGSIASGGNCPEHTCEGVVVKQDPGIKYGARTVGMNRQPYVTRTGVCEYGKPVGPAVVALIDPSVGQGCIKAEAIIGIGDQIRGTPREQAKSIIVGDRLEVVAVVLAAE